MDSVEHSLQSHRFLYSEDPPTPLLVDETPFDGSITSHHELAQLLSLNHPIGGIAYFYFQHPVEFIEAARSDTVGKATDAEMRRIYQEFGSMFIGEYLKKLDRIMT